jgi:hypothetical protein
MKSATHGDGIIEEIPSLVVDGGKVCGAAHGSIVDTMAHDVVTEESATEESVTEESMDNGVPRP